jgi:hypothetical protein
MSDDIQSESGDFAWGIIGSNRWETLRLDRKIDRDGIVRQVEDGVEYAPETREAAAVTLPFPRWRRRSDGQYEMDLGSSDPPRVRSFADLRTVLHQRPSWRGGELQLRDLDAATQELLHVIQGLHDVGFGVGLLEPRNVLVLVQPGAPAPRVILPDVGFVRFRGMLPKWMRPDVPFAKLWDKPAEWMNERSFDRQRYPRLASKFSDTTERLEGPGWDQQSDLRTVARLIAWVLAPDGRIRREIPSRDTAGWTKAEVWAVLKEASCGAFSNATALARALEAENARPSRHFVEQIAPPPPRRNPWRWVLPAAGGLALAGGIVAVLLMIPPRSTAVPCPLCPECPPTSKLPAIVCGDYLKADGDTAREIAALKKLYDPGVLDPRKDRQDGELACRQRLTEATLSRLAKRGQQFPETIYREGIAQEDASKMAETLKEQFQALYALRNGSPPTPKDYEPWLSTLGNLGYLH